MRDRDFLDPLEWFCSIRNVIYPVKDISTVISGSAFVTDTDHDIFQDYESLLMLKGFARHLLRANGSIAVLAAIAVR